MNITTTLAPQEDQGTIIAMMNAPSGANVSYTQKYTDELTDIFKKIPEEKRAKARNVQIILTHPGTGHGIIQGFQYGAIWKDYGTAFSNPSASQLPTNIGISPRM